MNESVNVCRTIHDSLFTLPLDVIHMLLSVTGALSDHLLFCSALCISDQEYKISSDQNTETWSGISNLKSSVYFSCDGGIISFLGVCNGKVGAAATTIHVSNPKRHSQP